MGKVCDVLHGLKPTIMMIIVQIAFSVVNIFYKLCASYGMSLSVLIAYRFMFASATVLPLALIIERKIRPKLTWKIVFQAFVCALFGGSMAQNLYAESLMLTSVTFAAAMTNLNPAITFILAILFRIERLGIKTLAGKAKVIGTLMCITGAMLLTFYKSFKINIWSTHFDLMKKTQHMGGHVSTVHHKSNNILGLLMALGASLSASLSLIFQSKMSQAYPCPYSSTAIISIMGSIQAVVYALCVERNWEQWKLGWNIRLFAGAYMGIMGSGVMWVFIMSCVKMRGPLFVSIFNPLLLVLVALLGSCFLNEQLYLGSVVGAVIIICGLYVVLWGKSREIKKIARLVPSPIADSIQVEENGRESAKNFNYTNVNVMAITPNFIPEPDQSFQNFEDQDLEANNHMSSSQN